MNNLLKKIKLPLACIATLLGCLALDNAEHHEHANHNLDDPSGIGSIRCYQKKDTYLHDTKQVTRICTYNSSCYNCYTRVPEDGAVQMDCDHLVNEP